MRLSGASGILLPHPTAQQSIDAGELMSDQPARPFSHLDAPNAGLYRSVMGAFVAAKRRFLVHLRPEDVVESLRAADGGQGGPSLDGAAVEAALKQLEQWGNLRADPDTSRVTTVDDFYRTRYLYQLSAEGEAAELALAAYDEALGNRGELQSVALEDIRVRLGSLRRQAELPDPDPAVVHSLLRELSILLDGLAANATAFMSSLQRTIDLQEVDEDAFIAYKDRLIGYLERFIGDLVVKSAEIVTTLRDLERQPNRGRRPTRRPTSTTPTRRCGPSWTAGARAGRACARGSSATARTRRRRRCCDSAPARPSRRCSPP
jgi:uncharacterized protein (TIGR02677 family)